MGHFIKATLLALLLIPACAMQPGSDSAGNTGSGGKADDLGAACDTAALDEHGICRKDNGQFASAVCCEVSFAEMCADTNPDTDGKHCRNEVTGQFAPAACCDALCAGAALDQHGICRNEDGTFADHGCCADECLVAQEEGLDADDFAMGGSCAQSCDGASPQGDCFCDDGCTEFGDCCADKVDECGGAGNEGSSCEGFCGQEAPDGCFCDDNCAELGDCCADKVDACDGGGNELPDCSDPCANAVLEQGTGICRDSENGQFVNAECCAAAFVELCEDTSPDADGEHCRDDVTGQFAPAICCDALCEGAALDRSGFCRNTDGTFAHAGCCADECAGAQGGLGRNVDCGAVE